MELVGLSELHQEDGGVERAHQRRRVDCVGHRRTSPGRIVDMPVVFRPDDGDRTKVSRRADRHAFDQPFL